MRGLNKHGDTIVEVLLAITIVGTVLVGAFGAINRSLKASQQAQERSQATKLVEIQLERLKSATTNTVIDLFNAGKPRTFCLDNSLTRKDFPGAAIPLPSRDADILDVNPPGNYPANCVIDSAGNTYSGSSNSIAFYVSLERDSANVNQFLSRVRWIRAGASGREEAGIIYRVYP